MAVNIVLLISDMILARVMVSQQIRKTKTVSAILTSARTCFGQNGYERTSVDDIARNAGMTKGAIYHHFDSKKLIFDRVLVSLGREMAQSVASSLKSSNDLFDGVRAGLNIFFSLCNKDTSIKRMFFEDGPAVLGEKRWRDIDRQNFGGQITEVLAMGMQDGILKNHPLEPLTDLFNGMIIEAILRSTEAEDFNKASQIYIESILFLLSGIKKTDNKNKKTHSAD